MTQYSRSLRIKHGSVRSPVGLKTPSSGPSTSKAKSSQSASTKLTGQGLTSNLMEELVIEEVNKQFDQLPHKLTRHVKKVDIVAFALNRLPALYATTEKGRSLQLKEGTAKFKAQIQNVVKQGFAAAGNDPLRVTGTWHDPQLSESEQALEELKTYLRVEDLTWQNLAKVVRTRMIQTARGEISLEGEIGFNWDDYPLHQHSS
jgi:hypothetical protein